VILHFKVGERDVKQIRQHNYSDLLSEAVIDIKEKSLFTKTYEKNMLYISGNEGILFTVLYNGEKELQLFLKEIVDKL
jgi:hypothetical protein